jgi:hypothetical protein
VLLALDSAVVAPSVAAVSQVAAAEEAAAAAGKFLGLTSPNQTKVPEGTADPRPSPRLMAR